MFSHHVRDSVSQKLGLIAIITRMNKVLAGIIKKVHEIGLRINVIVKLT